MWPSVGLNSLGRPKTLAPGCVGVTYGLVLAYGPWYNAPGLWVGPTNRGLSPNSRAIQLKTKTYHMVDKNHK